MLNVLLQRELKLAWRRPAELANPLVFFLLVVSLFPFAVSPEPADLAKIAPGVLWVAALFANMLTLELFYRGDFEDGSLEQLMLVSQSPALIALSKALAQWLLCGLPLLLLSPLLALTLALPVEAWPALMASLLLGTPVFCLIGSVGMSLTVGLRRGAILLALLVLPLLIPVLIFGASAVTSASQGLPYNGQLAFMGALLMFTLALAPAAAGAALKVSISS
ncbi:MAG TPA: heme exporter protein CcmB [Permianibacter sp.]|nr:heme exporter protein CcmB [Permianibacter sp.]